MAETFEEVIRQNKRNSLLLAILFSCFVIILGAVIGASINKYQLGGEWRDGMLRGMIFAFSLTIFMLIFSYFGGAKTVLAISHAKPIEKRDDPQLYNVVEEMSIAAGVPMPKIYIIDDTAPNAFATGKDPQHSAIAITLGLRKKLTREELQGVIAHEMSHIRNYDIRFAMLMAVLVGVVALLCDFFLRSIWYGGTRRSRSSSSKGNSGVGGLILLLIAILLAIIAPLVAKLIELAVSREREYLADASAVDLTRNPIGLANALEKIAQDKEVLEAANRATQHLYIINPIKPFEERAKTMFRTHPPVKDRIARLRAMG